MWQYLANGFIWGTLIGGFGFMCVIASCGYTAYGWGDYANLAVMGWGIMGAMMGGLLGPAIGFFMWSANSHERSRSHGVEKQQKT